MTEWDWSQLCGRSSHNFTVWIHDDFGHCFEQLVIACLTHILLAISSAFHLHRGQHRQLEGPLPRILTLHFRLIASILLAVSPIFILILSYLYLKLHLSLIDVVTYSIKIVSWLIHSGFIWKLHRYHHVHIRGPLSVVLSFLLTLSSIIIQLRTIILQVIHQSQYVNKVEEYVTYITGGLHLIYLITLIPNKRPELTAHQVDPINDLSHEQDALIESSSHPQYHSIEGHELEGEGQLGVAEDGRNCFSKLFFWWVQPLMLKGSKGKLDTPSDLFELPCRLKTQAIEETFKRSLESQRIPTQDNENTPAQNNIPDVIVTNDTNIRQESTRKISILKALNRTFGLEYYSLGILKLLSDLLGFAGPILLNLLVSYMENQTEPVWHGYVYAAGLFLSTLLNSLMSIHFTYIMQVIGLKIRAAIITTVYRKAIKVSTVTMSAFSTGEIVNFMSTDTDRIVNFCPSFHAFWSLPFQIAVSLYLLYTQVGLAFLAGLAFAILLIPINRWLAIKIGQLSTDMMNQKDSRVKMMSEILFGIRVIKFYAWEKHFSGRVNELRDAELKSLKGRKYLDALCVYFWATTPVLISILTFTTYALLGHKLTAAKVFTSLALFNMLISPLNAFPWVLNGLIEAWVSLKRVQSFLQMEELDLSAYYTLPLHASDGGKETAIEIQNGKFSWEDETDDMNSDHTKPSTSPTGDTEEITGERSKTLQLTDITLNIKKGELIGIIGKVGSGKSSIFSAILAEVRKVKGHVTVASLSDGFGLASQEAWIQHATVRENILFGLPYNSVKYDQIVEACALTEDFKVLPAGDQTEIGENGVTLSGGQKARVALARAVYQDKDIYLLDDPLAAVDAHVAQHLFSRCIMGVLKTKTRLLCTHHTYYLRDADHVVLMEDGHITKIGTPEEILGSDSFEKSTDSKNPEENQKEADLVGEGEGQGSLVEEEEKDTGVVKLHVYKSYWRAVGNCLAPMVLLALFLMQASRNINDWWLSYWVTHSHHHNDTETSGPFLSRHQRYLVIPTQPFTNITEGEDNVSYYLMVYGILAGANSIFTLFRAFLFAYGGICAATGLHRRLLTSILKAPIKFFDVTPIGRIINRFSSDLYSIDDSLPFIMNIFLAQTFGLLGTIAVTCYGLPWFTLLLVPLGIIYYYIQRFYRHTSRELKRISSVTLSPIYAHFSETVTGLVTIRALRHSQRFQNENQQRLEENQKAQFASNAAGQWLGIRLQMLGVAMVTGVAFIAVLEHHFQTVNAGLVGLAISYALSVTNLLNGVVTSFTETEKQMVSVERAAQYIEEVPQESARATLHTPPLWPIQGAVIFTKVKLQYRPGLPNALDDVTFETQPGEKVGIVGRTGSGKSSLFLALFRMVDIQSGYIHIDGINVGHLHVQELRSRLAIIPQDPFLFSGSIRENLDPTSSYSDHDLDLVLEKCHLKFVVDRLGGLMSDVGERGRHFSVGQRQLLCLARALLTKAKVLCIDEATASVDQKTDALIQQTIREEFRNNTVLTIAHRINTVMDSDRVIVMHLGQVAEFASPNHLLQNPKSLFYSLVHGKQ